MKEKKQHSSENHIDPLRSAVKDHVAELGASLVQLRYVFRNITEYVAIGPDNPDLESYLTQLQLEINGIFDTMVRVRWAALGNNPAAVVALNQTTGTNLPEEKPMSGTKPTVYVVDDNPSILKALSRMFRSMDYHAESFSSAKQFLAHSPDAHPACVILDVRMPRMSGLDLQHELADQGSDLPIIFITGHGDIDMAVQAMKDGAADFLPKPFDDQDLLDSVERALERHEEIRLAGEQRQEVEEHMKRLPPREREVFEHVVKGMLNKQVAFDLGTCEKTIKVHRARVMQKMEAESLADLVRMANRVGIEGPSTDPTK